MKSGFKIYTLVWAICFALFSAIVFLVPVEQTGSFWLAYTFTALAFLVHLLCTYATFKKETAKKFFYNVPLITVSYTGLIVMLVASAVCMSVPGIPHWLGLLVCLLVLGFTAIAAINAGAAAAIVDRMDARVDNQTSFIRDLTVDAESLMHRANAPMLKALCKKVYEAVRYSDPMSKSNLSAIEQRIKEEFDALTDAVIADDLDSTESAVKELLTLIAQRNNKCKSSK